MKVIAKTTSSILLLDPTTRDILPAGRPAVITWTQFFQARTGLGQIEVLQNGLPNEANDADFLQYLKEAEDEDLAIASYASLFLDEEEEEKSAPKKKAAAKTTAEKPVQTTVAPTPTAPATNPEGE